MPDAVMLFAAGFGTRMRPLTEDRPKPLIPVAGRTLLDHALALTAGIPVRVVNAHYRAGQIVDHLRGTGIAVQVEEPDILDTGGGLKAALPRLGAGPVYTLNTDAVWQGPNPLSILAGAWDPARMDALLLCVPLARAQGRAGRADFRQDAQGRLHRPAPGAAADLVYTGAQIVTTQALETIPDRVFSVARLWEIAAAQGRFFGTPYPGHWCDVGHPGGIAEAEAMLGHAHDV